MEYEDPINYNVVFPLKIMCIINIVAQLWKNDEIKEVQADHLSKHNYPNDYYGMSRDENLLPIFKKVVEKLHALPLPNLLKENAKDFIRPVGMRIAKWISSFEKDFWDCNSKKEHIDSICFTNEGEIDKSKTMELHLDNPKIRHIFERMCEYCLGERISRLWESMSKEDQDYYTKDVFGGGYHQINLRTYWICLLTNNLHKLMHILLRRDWRRMYSRHRSIQMNMFVFSISEDNLLASKYFWNMFSHEEKQKYIVKCTNIHLKYKRGIYNTEPPTLACFLLAQMNKQQQVEVFKKNNEIVLESLFLHIPWRMFFFVTIQSTWKYLGSEAYIHILEMVLRENKKSSCKLFKQVWSISPTLFKNHFIQHVIQKGLINSLRNLFEIDDEDSINAFYNDANIGEKRHILFSTITIDSFKLVDFIYTGKFFFIEKLVSKSMLPDDEIKILKHSLVHGFCKYYDEWYWSDFEHSKHVIEEFMNWCCDSPEDAVAFKNEIAEKVKTERFLANFGDKFDTLESIVKWCCNGDVVQINKFKQDISSYEIMAPLIWHLVIKKRNFEFADKFLAWCFPSEEKLEEFKQEFLFSEDYAETFIVQRYENCELKNIQICKLDLIKQLIRFFHPFQCYVFNELKEAYVCLKKWYVVIDSGVEAFFNSSM